MFIPILAYSLVKASEQGFVNFMSSMGGASSNAGNTGASQKVTGANIGNTSVGKGSHTGINGTTTDMGGGAEDRNSNNYSSEGTYKDQTTQSSNGSKNSNLSNSVADMTMKDNELSSVTYKNISSEITQAHQDSYNQAKATEKSSLESMSNTLSSGISTSLSKGQIYTNSDDFSKNTGVNNADSRSIVQAQNEAIVKNLNKKLSEAQTNSTTSDTGFRLSGNAGWDAKDTFVGKITGVSAGVNGSATISGTSTDGKSFSVDMSKDEMESLQKSVSDSLSKTFSQDSGLALRASQSLANNEVFNSSSLKSNMDAYTKSHSIAEKYSENFSKSDSNSISFGQKVMPEVTKQFIQSDERLKAMYESGNERAIKDAVNDATYRIDKAYTQGNGVDFNKLNNAFITVTGFDSKGNISNLVNTQIDQGKNLDSHVANSVSLGKDNISNTTVNNSINQNPTNNYQSQANDFMNKSTEDMNNHKENTKLNTQDTIEKGGKELEKNKEENNNRSRAGKALEATAVNGVTDIIKGAKNLIDDTTIKTPGSDGKQEIQNSQKNWNENTDKIFGNQNNKPTNDGLSDVKTQLEFIKDDLNEINSVNTQTIDKKGGKK